MQWGEVAAEHGPDPSGLRYRLNHTDAPEDARPGGNHFAVEGVDGLENLRLDRRTRAFADALDEIEPERHSGRHGERNGRCIVARSEK